MHLLTSSPFPQTSISPKRGQSLRITTHSAVLVKVFSLVLIALVIPFLSFSSTIHSGISNFPGIERYREMLPKAFSGSPSSLLPQRLIVLLEVSAILEKLAFRALNVTFILRSRTTALRNTLITLVSLDET